MPMNGPATIVLFPIDCAIAFLFSSQAFNAFISCTIFSFFPCRMSLILTVPILTSLSSKKSNSLNRPSSLSSLGPEGKAESGTGGEEGVPLISSASRRRASPPHSGPSGSVMWRDCGRWEFAHSIRPASTSPCG